MIPSNKFTHKNTANKQQMSNTVNLRNSHTGLNNLIHKSQKIKTTRTSMPTYTTNEDIFKKVPYIHPKMNTSRNDTSTHLIGDDNTRPSPSFLTLARDLQKQRIFIDQYDGPSSLITISPDRKHNIIKATKMKNPYQEELETYRKSGSLATEGVGQSKSSSLLPDISRKSMTLPEGTNLLKSSRQQYQEYLRDKNDIDNYKNWKQTKNYINKRHRLIKNGWRHGVVGVENPLDPDSEVYVDTHKNKVVAEKNKDFINNRRKKNLSKYNNTSAQISFGVDPKYMRKDKKVIEVDHQWKSKKFSPERFTNTHNHLFVPQIPTKRETMKARRLNVQI